MSTWLWAAVALATVVILWLLLVGALLAYLVMPVDVVPDFIPIAGQLDDAILVAAVLAYVVRRAGRHVIGDLWPGSQRGLRAVLALARA